VIFIALNRFRWVFCQLEALRHCFPPSVRHILEELPETLDETYERILRDINKANRDHANRLLQCLTVAVRPLRVEELAEVLAVDFGTGACGGTSKLNPDWRWDDQQQAVLSTCSSLISIVDEKDFQVVQFSHFSVKEYLMSPRLAESSANVSRYHILLEPAHTILAKACLGVLLRLRGYYRRTYRRQRDVEKTFPLAQYAARHWVDHAKFEQVSSHVREAMEDLFDLDKPFFYTWLQVHNMDVGNHTLPLSEFSFIKRGRRFVNGDPLYYAALCRFYDLTEHLIMKNPQQVNARGGEYVSPLGVALGREHFDVAQLLYEHGADVDVRGFSDRTLLYAASERGNRQIVEWLLNHGANPNLHTGFDTSTTLHIAASSGWVEISQIFLQRNADKNALNGRGRTPLHEASDGGHINVARLLLEHSVDVNSLDNDLSTALHLASKQGHVDVAQILLEHGVDVNARDSNCSTALHLASKQGYINIARFLLAHGVDVNVRDKNRFTALHLASERGHTDIARMLFGHGVEVNAWGKNRSTALHLASESGKLEVVCLLLEHGADVEVRDYRYRTPLQVASGEQRDEITKLLSERRILNSRTTL
jgi:ankyrin repeat protein